MERLRDIEAGGTRVCLVSKYWDVNLISELYSHGFRCFAESRVDALAQRAGALPDDIEWHFVGNIQKRDLSTILRHATMIQSFDRIDLIDKLVGTNIKFLLQINIAEQPDRNGIMPTEISTALDAIEDVELKCSGFMAHPPLSDDTKEVEGWFTHMQELISSNHGRHPSLKALSMGTSADYALAIEHGATMIRLGRLLSMD